MTSGDMVEEMRAAILKGAFNDDPTWQALANDAAQAAATIAKGRIDELRHLIWEMDETVNDCCGCLGHLDDEFRERINNAALKDSPNVG